MSTDNEIFQNDYLKLIQESMQKNERKKRFSKIGKLGGRPRKIQKKAFKYSLSLTEKQNDLAKDICRKNEISLQEFLRRKIENEPLPNSERNRLLIQVFSHFNRIKSFFNSQIWEEYEREEFKKLLTKTCGEVLKAIKK